MGIAAPQIGISRAAVVQPPGDTPAITLLTPGITDHAYETDEHCEGYLSFFDGLVPCTLEITIDDDP
ncbi:hypothetical protein [Streptomyces sp. NPDC059256]|uniref:hypothetical protein n=1 Tax=Streptomyces sp. NPDC059256 TaxID=3346794 RepID=UPI00369960A9